MDTETGSVDILFEKPRLDVRRSLGKTVRGTAVTYKSLVPGFNPTVMKLIRGNEISRNQAKSMSKSILDDFSPEVSYSLKKKKRWQDLNSVNSVLSTIIEDSPSVTVSAIEKNPTENFSRRVSSMKGVRTYGRVKSDSNVIEAFSTKSGNGGPLLSLIDSLECKNKKYKNKRKWRKQEIRPQGPEVTFIIDRQSDIEKLPAMSFDPYRRYYRGERSTHRFNKFYDELLDEEEEIFDESDEEVAEESKEKEVIDDFDGEIIEDFDVDISDESDEEIEEKSKSFVLSDFIKSPSPKKEKIRQKKIRDVVFLDEIPSEIMESANHQKPLNEHEVLKDSSFISKEVDLCSFFLRPEHFVQKLEEWGERYKDRVDVIWLDEQKTKCVVDFSRTLHSRNLAAVVAFTVLGKKKMFLRITFNTNFPFEYPEKELQKFSIAKKRVSSLFDLISECLKKSSSMLFKKNDFKLLEEAFQCKSDATVECFDDYELVEKFTRLTEPSSSESTSVSSLESLHFDSCEFCGQRNPSNMIDLSCIHSLCLSCARFAFKDQIVSHSKELICPICESTQDIMRLTFAVPIPLIKAFLREKFSRIAKNGVQECPKCIGQFEKVPGAHSVSCKKCHIAFCQKCLHPPHFPLSCEQMKTWFPKFEEQYKFYSMRRIPKYGQCFCGNYIELQMVSQYGCNFTCSQCKKHFYGDQNGIWRHYHYGDARNLRVLNKSEIPTYIKKSFAEICIEARDEFNNESKAVEIRKLGAEFLGEEQLREFIDLRSKVLKLIEYGTAWLYFEKRNQDSDENKEISKTLKNLRYLLTFIVNQITNKSSFKIQENFTALQDSYSKALTLF